MKLDAKKLDSVRQTENKSMFGEGKNMWNKIACMKLKKWDTIQNKVKINTNEIFSHKTLNKKIVGELKGIIGTEISGRRENLQVEKVENCELRLND